MPTQTTPSSGTSDAEGLELLLFRQLPPDLIQRPSLASSLQNFESTMFSIALERYPHALATCVSGIESAFHAGLVPPPQDGEDLKALVARAGDQKPMLKAHKQADLREMRRKRNRIVHEGFSPKDDQVAARLLLRIALPFLASCYQQFFALDLMRSLDGDFAKHLELALTLYSRNRNPELVFPQHWFAAVRHWIRSNADMSSRGYWERELLEESQAKWELIEGEVESRLRERTAWRFDCPMSSYPEAFICHLDETVPKGDPVILGEGYCVNCGFSLTADVRLLTEALCAKQRERQQKAILADLGSPLLWGTE